MTEQETFWYISESFKMLAPSMVGVLGYLVGRGQWQLAKFKLNSDLFDRRFRVYEAAQVLVAETFSDFNITSQAVGTFRMAIEPAPFLFPSEMNAFLQGLLKASLEIRANTSQIKKAIDNQNSAESAKFSEKEQQLVGAFTRDANQIVTRFQKYLNLRSI